MNYFTKNRSWKDFFISFLLLLAMVVVIFSLIGVSEGATNKDTTNKGHISKNLKVKSITISNSTVGGLKGSVDKSTNRTTIYLKKGVYKFNNTNIKINKTLTIIGKGSAKYVIIDARRKGRVFDIIKYGKLTLINVTIKNGRISEEYSYGGAIYNEGSLVINNSILTKNSAFGTGWNSYGGAIYNEGSLVINNSILTKNSAFGTGWNSYGGAICDFGSLKVKNSAFKQNNGDFGAAIYCEAIYLTYVDNCKFINNFGGFGSGIYNIFYDFGSKIILKNSYFKNCIIENEVSGSKIVNNKFDINSNYNSNLNGVIFNLGDNNTIAYNTIISRGFGLYQAIESWGDNNKIYKNKIYGSFASGIHISGFYNTISNNDLYGKNRGRGISLDYHDNALISRYNKVSKNKVAKFEYGIYVYKGLKTNKISYNKLINNKIGLASSYKFKNKSNIFKGNRKNIIKIKN